MECWSVQVKEARHYCEYFAVEKGKMTLKVELKVKLKVKVNVNVKLKVNVKVNMRVNVEKVKAGMDVLFHYSYYHTANMC